MDKAFIKNPVEAYEKLKEGNKKLKAELEQYKNVINKLAGKTIAITTYDTPIEFCDHKDLTIQQLKAENEKLKEEQAEIKKYLGISHKTILKRLEELTEFRDRDRDEIYNSNKKIRS